MERTTALDAIGSQPYGGGRPRVDAGVLDDLKADGSRVWRAVLTGGSR
jgi:hypothetical protein